MVITAIGSYEGDIPLLVFSIHIFIYIYFFICCIMYTLIAMSCKITHDLKIFFFCIQRRVGVIVHHKQRVDTKGYLTSKHISTLYLDQNVITNMFCFVVKQYIVCESKKMAVQRW